MYVCTMHVYITHSLEVRAYDDRARCRNVGTPYKGADCPVVVCPYLCSSDLYMMMIIIMIIIVYRISYHHYHCPYLCALTSAALSASSSSSGTLPDTVAPTSWPTDNTKSLSH